MSKKVKFNFSGLMSPVFTSLTVSGEVHVENIDKYAQFLKSKGVNGVLVNGTTGEGPVLNVAERKLVAENWSVAAGKHQLSLMVQIGGAPLPDVIDLAKHAEKLQVDAVLCLPELYFKPKCIPELIGYLKIIAQNCPTRPLLYYHHPVLTGLNFNMPKFCDAAEEEISNFVGIKYTSNDLDMGAACLKDARNILLGADTLLSSAILLGFDSAILTTLNIYPEISVAIVDAMKKNNMKQAQEAQNTLTQRVRCILNNGNGEWVPSMKKAFNALSEKTGINAGPLRSLSA